MIDINKNCNPSKVLCVHDLSCVGRCSLGTAISILSSFGLEPIALPTALYSMHTGFDEYFVQDLSIPMTNILKAWDSLDIKFNAIYSGFLKSISQINVLLQAIDTYNTLTIVDPAFGDDGLLYSGYDSKFVKHFAKYVVPKADILLPNITEAMYLTNTPYQSPPYTRAFVSNLIDKLLQLGGKYIIISSIRYDDSTIGVVLYDGKQLDEIMYNYVDHSCSGAGDLWASLLVGYLLKGNQLLQSAQLASQKLNEALMLTVDFSNGINYFSIINGIS
ncbi:MAG: bifunctional hydroxymethylpyrimidine kinase/phosphomethylpyrimidine kinase [Firmicutes bacterium]|nr:bifunctional hydroxymethylpyrimidine kinase/phosphomethylpyrimidine kinase [Bacillota bacterium]MCL1953692.1 bifunctional hydroxymethylpyrimidine kinase/phosphomethylpyrimidine kinase [Bacillota bacterium]